MSDKSTNVTILDQGKIRPLETILLVRYLDEDEMDGAHASEYQNIQLIQRNYLENMDLMIAWNDGNSARGTFLGYFNDGIV